MTIGLFHVSAVRTAHVALSAALVGSVRRTMPGVEIVHLTDAVTAPLPGVDTVQRGAGGPVALACLEAYADAGEGDWLFLDTDVLVLKDVRHVFDQPFDVAVATRDGTMRAKEYGTKFMGRMPFNKGAVFSRSPIFWATAARTCQAVLKPKRQAWMGDQDAMNLVISDGAFEVRVLSNAYNYPPFTRDEDVSDKAILHFKGPRKAWMLERAA